MTCFIQTVFLYRPWFIPPGRPRNHYAYLRAANKALSEDFQYVREVVQDNHAVLEFTVKVDGIFVNGVDIITFEGDQIVEFKVMVRPLKAVNAVWKQMGEMLEQLKAAS